MLTWTDCPARTPEQQIILAQLEILRRLDPVEILRRLDPVRAAAASGAVRSGT
jgi:hypothetical protein